MAAANESQGLKIAVAVFITLTVALAVTTYFTWTNYSQASAKQAEAEEAKSKALQLVTTAQTRLNELKDRAGYTKMDVSLDSPNQAELWSALQEAAKKDYDNFLDAQLSGLNGSVGKVVDAYKQAGGKEEKVADLQQQITQAVVEAQQTKQAPNDLFIRERLFTILNDLSQLSIALQVDNQELRESLARVDQVNATRIQEVRDELKKTQDDLLAEQENHKQARETLLAENTKLQGANAKYADDFDHMQKEMLKGEDQSKKERTELVSMMKDWRARAEKQDTVMDVPDGKIVSVDYNRRYTDPNGELHVGEVYTNLTKKMGARERLQLAVFDRNSPGLPSDSPKGTIELVNVGEKGSVARIIKTTKPSDPIRENDLVYSSAWSPSTPVRFALIGKLDADRDGKDDREDVKRMITAAGGAIDFDLPEPNVGKPTGAVTGRTTWYVLDDREPLRKMTHDTTADDPQFLAARKKAFETAKELGVRQMRLSQLLSELGYTYGTPVKGKSEALDQELSRKLTTPKRNYSALSGAGAPAPSAGSETPPAATEPPKADDNPFK